MIQFKRLRKKHKRVMVAMSGGVDSSVAAYVLKKRGYAVVGVTMCFGLSERDAHAASCCNPAAIEDARRVADQLGIQHYVVSFGKLLEEGIIANFISEYSRGRTPNPCVRCNEILKFDLLFQKARTFECASLATGHYAQIVKRGNGYQLLRACDRRKDQAYFLYRLPVETLPCIQFPLGRMRKSQVRRIAQKLGLRVADKPESQDICFVPPGSLENFLRARTQSSLWKPGPIVDGYGKVLGQHQGLLCYTIGQRKGLRIAHTDRLYVNAIDVCTNTLVVGERHEVYGRIFTAEALNWLAQKPTRKKLVVDAQIRYNHPQAPATLRLLSAKRVHVTFTKPQWAITPGQSVVFFHKRRVLGGAIIDRKVE